jgi:hypothetical protein
MPDRDRKNTTSSRGSSSYDEQGARADPAMTAVGKRTLVGSLPQPPPTSSLASSPATMWEHAFDEPSVSVDKLGRVQAPRGVYLRCRPLPGSESRGSPVPFNALVHVERRTTQSHANERWCYVVATDAGIAGFCEERYLAIDPPEPTATLRCTVAGERLAAIATEAFGAPTDDVNSRLQVQVLYLANRGRAGVRLDHIELRARDRFLRGENEEPRASTSLRQGSREITEQRPPSSRSVRDPMRSGQTDLRAPSAVG